VEQAIAWRVRLASGTCAADELAACHYWRAQHPDNELAWQRLDALGGRFAAIPSGIGHAALDGARHDPQRRRALKALAVLVAAGGGGVLATHNSGMQPWLADLRTGVGERRKITLPDGGSLHLNASTAVDIQYTGEQRLVRLYSGEIFVETAADPKRRLFWVDTSRGRLRALGTRFLVRERGELCDRGRVAHFRRLSAGRQRARLASRGQNLAGEGELPHALVGHVGPCISVVTTVNGLFSRASVAICSPMLIIRK
jgi:transmembrane sensor